MDPKYTNTPWAINLFPDGAAIKSFLKWAKFLSQNRNANPVCEGLA